MENQKEVIRTVYNDQYKILESIIKLHLDNAVFDIDLTYGNGSFYKKGISQPTHRLDLDDTLENLTKVCSSNDTGFKDASVKYVIFDPPFLTWIRKNRIGNSNMIMARRFAGYLKLDELIEHYKTTIEEAARIMQHKGIFVFKCQDIIHNHKLFSTHVEIIKWAEKHFRLKDLFIQVAKHRLPMSNRKGTQKHARTFHCYWLVLQRWAK